MVISGESCSKQESTPQEDPYLTVFPTKLDFPYEGETIEVLIQSNAHSILHGHLHPISPIG